MEQEATLFIVMIVHTGLPLANPPLVMPGNAESNKLKYSVFVGYGSPP